MARRSENKGGREAELERLHAGVRRCLKCPLHESRTHAVPGEGNPHARLLFLGEAPGETEDKLGRPFVGRSGKFLDELFARHGIDRQAVYITGSVKCRPPHNRRPRNDELAICKEAWLRRQIELINPAVIVLLGQVAAWQLLGESVSLAQCHGRVRSLENRQCLLTYHPAAAMRFPAARAAMEDDFGKIAHLERT